MLRDRIVRWLFARLGSMGFLRARTEPRSLVSGFLLGGAGGGPRSEPLRPSDKVVIVGVGPAALSAARALRRGGHPNVLIVHRDQDFGGKCVVAGCMPTELFLARAGQPDGVVAAECQELVTRLKAKAKGAFEVLGYPLVNEEVTEIRGNTLVFRGETAPLAFDRLILATGSSTKAPNGLQPSLDATTFWGELSGRLLIVSDGNPAALSYADIALARGLTVTVVFTGKIPLAHLPSFQYFQRESKRRGVRILADAEVLEQTPEACKVRAPSGPELIAFDHLLYAGTPRLQLPEIDGRALTAGDIDWSWARCGGRADVFVSGDAAGFLTASEAELHGEALVASWRDGGPLPMDAFCRVPMRIHARAGLSFAGPPWSFAAKGWREIDFQAVGYTEVHERPGKLWYLLDRDERRVAAVHICHPESSNLATLAALLLPLPISDLRWKTCTFHPQAAEIFRVLVADAEKEISTAPGESLEVEPSPWDTAPIALPDVRAISNASFFERTFTAEERLHGKLDAEPHVYFSVLIALKAMCARAGDSPPALSRSRTGELVLGDGRTFGLETDPTAGIVVVSYGAEKSTVVVERGAHG